MPTVDDREVVDATGDPDLSARLEPAADENPDGSAMCLVTLAEVYRALGRADRAQRAIDQCRVLCERYGLPRWAAEVSREQAEICAATGDYRGAFEAYREYHRQFEVLGTSANDARGRMLEVMFQATDARRESGTACSPSRTRSRGSTTAGMSTRSSASR
ncbi:tetratricopeptide repeat protein [Pengzhenrongella sicca]|uniref:Tetratricopeptide repeat protein n=1 Tax=Pengzhenrongella sicca TaxID=2819238 RepID=A0A8A4ZDL6_9MICO|nr:tetratricopeptide repeat protein [Pengzhenrongella sicca]QTE30004.1 tetratricopeptide repeat protein [Pengzhenrongella sicca]